MALASENVQDWKKRSGHKRSGSDYATDERADESSDAAVPARSRHPRGTKLVNNPPTKAKRRERSDTTSTNRTGTGTIIGHSGDSAASTTPRHSTPDMSSPPLPDDKMPGQAESETDGTEVLAPAATTLRDPVRKVSSGASLTALSPQAPTGVPTAPASTQVTMATDESDTDFQSACSTSPRNSFESKKASQLDSDDSGTSTDDYKRHVTEYTDLPVRARISSTVTAAPQISPTLSDITANGRVRSRQGTN